MTEPDTSAYRTVEPGRGLSPEEADALRSLLRECYYDLHPVTAGTSRSGGPGGAAITTHCIVKGGAWTDAEQSLIERIERAIHRPDEPLITPGGTE